MVEPAAFASTFMAPKKWRQIEKWTKEVQRHLAEGTLTVETASVISKEYKMGDEPPPKGTVRATYETETSSVTVHGYQPMARPMSAFSHTQAAPSTYRPRSSMTNRSSSRPENSPSVAVVRPSPIRVPPRTETTKTPSTKDTGTSANINRSRRCCCCCSTGSMTANASSPGGWVSPSVANTLQANRNRAAYNQPARSPSGAVPPQETRPFKLTYQHTPTYWKPEVPETNGQPSGYPPWVTGASVVISANQIRSSPQVAFKSPSGTVSRSDAARWNAAASRWASEPTNSKLMSPDPVPVH